MIHISGIGRTLVASAVVAFGLTSTVAAQDVTEDQIKAARATINALGVTSNFDGILPNLAERLKSTLIQASPNYEAVITATVDETAITLASRRADLEREAASIYAKSFTIEELNAITAFYTSETGKKLLRDGPIATREMVRAADIWASGISRDLATESDKALEKVIGAQQQAAPAAPADATTTPQQ